MTVRVYRSSDAGAPVLSGQIGSLIALLDACLVNGYGALPSSGWSKEFSGTNLAAYRAASGNRLRLRVDDTAALEARIVGYESMSGISSGLTNAFPTEAQIAGGMFVRKSSAADSTARGWVVVATATAFYLLIHIGNSDWLSATAAADLSQTFFGDIVSFKNSDAYGTLIVAAVVTGVNNARLGANWAAANANVFFAGHYIARGYDGAASKQVAKRAMYDVAVRTPIGASGYAAFPDVVTSEMIVSPMAVLESDAGGGPVYRGILPGLWAPLHGLPAAHGDTLDGSGSTAGKSFQLFACSDTSLLGRAMIELSDTW